MMPFKLKIFVMLMATSATAASTLTNILALNQSMEMNLGLLLGQMGQTINLKVDKVVVDENVNIYNASASMSQIQSFSKLTGMEIPFSSDLKNNLLFRVQETITPSGRSYDGKIALDSSLNLWDSLAIPFTGELTENSFSFEAKGKTFEVNWKKEDEAHWYNELVIEFKDPSSGEEVEIRQISLDSSEIKFVLRKNHLRGTMTVSKTGRVTMEFRPDQKIYDTIDKFFLLFGEWWFGEECTLERTRRLVTAMFEWNSILRPIEDLHVKGLTSVPSLYPKEYDWSWFQFKLPAFLFRSWA